MVYVAQNAHEIRFFQVLGKIYPFFEFFSMKFLGKVLGFSGRNHLNK